MLTTVYFATNRALTGPAGDWRSYGATIVTPSDPAALTYATAFVDNTDLTADTTGAITDIRQINTGGFSADAVADLSDPGRNLLVFIHGFANDFENGITRAAFNREWLAQEHVAGADTTVVADHAIGELLSVCADRGGAALAQPTAMPSRVAIAPNARLLSVSVMGLLEVGKKPRRSYHPGSG